MALSAAQLAQQKKQAEEMLFSGPDKFGFVKSLFFGRFKAAELFPYPTLPAADKAVADEAVAKLKQFAETSIDADKIDREADIPRSVIDGLGKLGVLGMTAPKELGGAGFTQQQYCKVLEFIGGHCASTAVFVNAHGSIGIRALVMFGTQAQKDRWLPGLVTGEKLAAFALTEPNAGSDAGNVQTVATPTPDGSAYVLNGTKHYITNGGIADVLTVMARTPVAGSSETKVTAFLVTPDMPGFQVVEARAEKCGIRGTATGRLAFKDMRVPAENVLGKVGRGLPLALTVLNFGRTTFGATCTGAAKVCLGMAKKHAKTRIQFQQPLAEFELVKKKIAFMAAHAFAMEAMTTQCAALIDRNADDYMLETAILKVFATEHLWTIVYDTLQVYGGKGYFCDEPLERMMRDARINTIGEGANEVLKAFIAVVGSRGPGLELDGLRKSAKHDLLGSRGKIWGLVKDQVSARATLPDVPVTAKELRADAKSLARQTRDLGLALPWAFLRAGTEERYLQSQLAHERIADIAIDLYAQGCVLSRLDHLLTHGNGSPQKLQAEVASGRHFLKLAQRRVKANFAALTENDDPSTVACADANLV